MLQIYTLFTIFVGLTNAVKKADVVIAGEGKIDSQTLEGKLIAGVEQLEKKHQKNCLQSLANLTQQCAS